MNQAYQVKLDSFEGPLDLLLHLINQYEIDIYDIPVAQITEQYMQYIHTMQQLELNIASEYLVMAATLLELKSKMLLPNQDLDDDPDEYMEDPREELMQRLIEYRKYKIVVENLKDKEISDKQTFTRPPAQFRELDVKQPVIQGSLSIYDMLGALGKMLKRKQWNTPLDTKVQRVEISIEDRMREITQFIKNKNRKVSFDEMFEEHTRTHIVVTFMALLELMKTKQVYCEQKKQLDTLYIFYQGE